MTQRKGIQHKLSTKKGPALMRTTKRLGNPAVRGRLLQINGEGGILWPQSCLPSKSVATARVLAEFMCRASP